MHGVLRTSGLVILVLVMSPPMATAAPVEVQAGYVTIGNSGPGGLLCFEHIGAAQAVLIHQEDGQARLVLTIEDAYCPLQNFQDLHYEGAWQNEGGCLDAIQGGGHACLELRGEEPVFGVPAKVYVIEVYRPPVETMLGRAVLFDAMPGQLV